MWPRLGIRALNMFCLALKDGYTHSYPHLTPSSCCGYNFEGQAFSSGFISVLWIPRLNGLSSSGVSCIGLSFEPILSFRFGKCVHWLCMWVWYLCPVCKRGGCSHKQVAMRWILFWNILNSKMWWRMFKVFPFSKKDCCASLPLVPGLGLQKCVETRGSSCLWPNVIQKLKA